MKKVYIADGCVGCGACQSICPNVFKVDDTASIREDAVIDAGIIDDNEMGIVDAMEICPVNVIKFEEEPF